MVTSLRDAIRSVLSFKTASDGKRNPTQVNASQINAYVRGEIDAKVALLAGNGDFPLSQYGDLSFTIPNVSSRYEGATTVSCPVVYQVEQDGTRNYLRNGMDGQTLGVYLCKMTVDANGRMSGYSPLATPWRPAWLPVADKLMEILHGPDGVVMVRCQGTYNGALPAGSIYYAASYCDGTLNPDLHTRFKVYTGLTQAGMDERYRAGSTTLIPDHVDGNTAFLLRWPGGAMSGPIQIEVTRLTSLSVAIQFPATEYKGWTGTDCLGQVQDAANQNITLASLGEKMGETMAYFQRDVAEPQFGGIHSQPTIPVLSYENGRATVMFVHESTSTRADGIQARRIVTRMLYLDFANKTFTSAPELNGSVMIATSGTSYVMTGPMCTVYEFGAPAIGDYLCAWSRCQRTKEVIASSVHPSYGRAMFRLITDDTTDLYLRPWARNWSGKQQWEYISNYPSPIGSSCGLPLMLPDNSILIYSTMGWCKLSPDWQNPIPYTYPDGQGTEWYVDSGRAKMANSLIQPTRTLAVTLVDGTVRLSGMAQRGAMGNRVVAADGTRSGTWGVSPALDADIEATVRATMTALNPTTVDFCYYRPGKVGHLNDPLVVIGHCISDKSQGFAYVGIYEITTMTGDSVMAVGPIQVSRLSGAIVSSVYNSSLLSASVNTGTLTMAEGDDFVFLGGSTPFTQNYPGNQGQPTLVLAIQPGQHKVIRTGLTRQSVNTGQTVWLPTIGPAIHNLTVDTAIATTTVTMTLYGKTYATVGNIVGEKVIVTQAVYGSWNLYVAEEVRCQIIGVTGMLPKMTLDLRTIKADPRNTTFYLYAQLNNGTFEYVVSPTMLLATRLMIPIGTVVTSASQVSEVNVRKTFSIDGFSFSVNLMASAAPASSGYPSEPGFINWPGVAT